MAGPKRQVGNLVALNLIVVFLILATFNLNYMNFTGCVDVGLRKATYHFVHEGDPSFIRCSYDELEEKVCKAQDSSLADLRPFCEELWNFKLTGLAFLVTSGAALVCLLYVTLYLLAMTLELHCAKSFSPGLAQFVALCLYILALGVLIELTFYFDFWSDDRSKIAAGMIVLTFGCILLGISTVYYVTLARTTLPIMMKKLEEDSKPLLVPLLKGYKDAEESKTQEVPAAVPEPVDKLEEHKDGGASEPSSDRRDEH